MRWLVPLAVLTGAKAALACSFAGQTPHQLDEAEIVADAAAPGRPDVEGVGITRGRGPRDVGCSQQVSSCDDMGVIELSVSAADDRSPADELGYRLSLASGELPAGLQLPAGAVRAERGLIVLPWSDGASDDQEAFSFELSLVAVDLAGNEGPPTQVPLRSLGGLGAALPALLPGVAFAGLWIALKRRRP